jgi:nitrite reductase/ring-hydroxylating ferredoxin subunit
MSEEPIDTVLYAICGADDIAHRQGRAFSLERVFEDGGVRPWVIFVVRWGKHVFGYVNSCPHQGDHLDWERNQFFDPNGTRLMCGKHGALFELDTGLCIEGPCAGARLEPVRLQVVDGDICIAGVTLAEDEEDEDEETAIGDVQ